MAVEEEGRQGRALRGRQPGLRVHLHWHSSVSRCHLETFIQEKYFARLGERSQQVEEAVEEAISYWQDRLRVRRRVSRSTSKCPNNCLKGFCWTGSVRARGCGRAGAVQRRGDVLRLPSVGRWR